MSGYRVLYGYNRLKRVNGEKPAELPSVGSIAKSPYDLITNCVAGTFVDDSSKWKRFGAGIESFNVTPGRTVNLHNDLGMRLFTVATTGMVEPTFSLSGFVAAENLEWLKYAFNTEPTITTLGDKQVYTYKYKELNPPMMFDIAYVQSNSKTNEFAGEDEFHIMTGCAIDTVSISYEMGSDAGVKFQIDGLGLMDWWAQGKMENMEDFELDTVPSDVFSTGCICRSKDGISDWSEIAQTDSGSVSINNFLERRPDGCVNWGSGYSMGTFNVEAQTTTYSNNTNKYVKAMYGYEPLEKGGEEPEGKIFGVTKAPYFIPFLKIHTDDGDEANKTAYKNALSLTMEHVTPTSLTRDYSTQSAILENVSLRSRNLTIKLTKKISESINTTSDIED